MRITIPRSGTRRNRRNKHKSCTSRIIHPHSSINRRRRKKNGGLNHVAGKGHGRHAQLKKMIKVCIYKPVSGSTTLTEADSRRRNEKSAKEAAGRSGQAENGLSACEISLPAVSYSPSAEQNINISPYFSAPGLKPCEHGAQRGYTLWLLSDHKKHVARCFGCDYQTSQREASTARRFGSLKKQKPICLHRHVIMVHVSGGQRPRTTPERTLHLMCT